MDHKPFGIKIRPKLELQEIGAVVHIVTRKEFIDKIPIGTEFFDDSLLSLCLF